MAIPVPGLIPMVLALAAWASRGEGTNGQSLGQPMNNRLSAH